MALSIITHQNAYSISHLLGTVTTQWLPLCLVGDWWNSHLLGTVTTQWLPLWRCSRCSLVPDTRDCWTVTISDTHVIRYPLPWGLCRNLSTRYLVGNSIVTTWEDTRYLGHYTQSLCRNQGDTDTLGRMCTPVREAFSYGIQHGIRHIHCDSMKYDLMFHWITMNMPYSCAVCRMKMPPVREYASSLLFCSLPLVPLVSERVVTTSSLSSHSKGTTWGVLLCIFLNNNITCK